MTAVHQPRAEGRFIAIDEDALVPPVCICGCPSPNALGECFVCKRPYKPEVPGFDACREAWRDRLEENACV